jgi:hypothetical protein
LESVQEKKQTVSRSNTITQCDAMYRNKPGQTIRVFAFALRSILVNGSPVQLGEPVTGIANTITMKLSKDGDEPLPSQATHPTETEDGYYVFPLTQDETVANTLDPYPESSVSGVQVIAVNYDRQLVDQALIIEMLASTLSKVSLIDPSISGVLYGDKTRLQSYIGERHIKSIPTPDYSGLDIRVVFEVETSGGRWRDVDTVANNQIAKTTDAVSFVVPEGVASKVRELRYSIRNNANEKVLLTGPWNVEHAPL